MRGVIHNERKNSRWNDWYVYIQRKVIKQIVKRDDEYTKQIIKDYVRNKYPKENIRIDFLDEEVVEKIIELGIVEYQRRKGGEKI